MKPVAKEPVSEQSISHGTRHVGALKAKAGGFECFDDEGRSIGIAPDVLAARRMILDADRRRPPVSR